MTVAELIELLKLAPPDHQVILAKDQSGNSYSPCAGWWLGQYVAETTWRGEALAEEDGPSEGYQADNAIILCPTY